MPGPPPSLANEMIEKWSAEGGKVALATREPALYGLESEKVGDKLILTDQLLDTPEKVEDFLDRTQEELGPIDLFISSCHRLRAVGPTWEMDYSDWWRDLTNNLEILVSSFHSVIPRMSNRGKGRIIQILPGGSDDGLPYVSGYGAAVQAAKSYVESLSVEIQQLGLPIKIFLVDPGYIFYDGAGAGKPDHPASWLKYFARNKAANEVLPPDDLPDMVSQVALGKMDEFQGRFLSSQHLAHAR